MHEASRLEPYTDYILSAAACRVIWIGGGGGVNKMPAATAFSGASFHSCVILYCSIKLLKYVLSLEFTIMLTTLSDLSSLIYVSNLDCKSF